MTEPLFADPFTYVIQHMNSNPYVLSEAQKPSVIDFIKTLRYDYYNVHRSDCAVHNEPAYQNGPCDCGAAYSQFITDVLTAAGLIAHGKQSKALSQRLADGVMLFRLSPGAAPTAEIDWKDQYEKQKRRAEMWIAKYEKDIGPLERVYPAQAAPKELVNQKLVEALERAESSLSDYQQDVAFHEYDADVLNEVRAALDLYKKDQKVNTSQERVQKSEEIKQVPLTDEQIEDIAIGIAADDYDHDLVRRVERYHGIKEPKV